MKPDIKLIAADFDGTLLHHDGSISAYNKEMIYKAQEAGIIFAAATGRYPENASQIMEDEGIQCPVIASNGAVVDLNLFGQRIHENLMNPAAAQAVFDVLESFNEGYYIFGRRTVINRWQKPRHISERDSEHLAKLKRRVSYLNGLEACKEALDKPLYKFFVIFDDDNHPAAEIRNALAHIPGIEITSSGGRNLEIMPAGANKGEGLQVLARNLQIAPQHIMALGDQFNDLSMLAYAGLGVAMGNAVSEVRAQADAVTDSFDQDGVGKAIAKFCFQDT